MKIKLVQRHDNHDYTFMSNASCLHEDLVCKIDHSQTFGCLEIILVLVLVNQN